jgi:FkbM family methyltransferase
LFPICPFFPGRTRFFTYFTNKINFTSEKIYHRAGFYWQLDSVHSQQIYLYSCEPFTSKILSNLGIEATHSLDIGANRGWYSCLLKARNSKLVVYAFQPGNVMLEALKNNLKQFINNVRLVHVEQCGVGRNIGTALLSTYVEGNDGMQTIFPDESLSVSSQKEISITSLDSYFSKFLDSNETYRFLMKIDIEGSEMDVLRGGYKFIAALQPIVVMEVHSRH